MPMFNGFEHILMAVIKESAHSDDRVSDEERYDNAMKAMFGDFYEPTYTKTPTMISHAEIKCILYLQKSGLSLQAAIKKVVSTRMKKPANDAEKERYNEKLTILTDRIRKHIQRNKTHYDEFIAPDSDDGLMNSPYLTDKEKIEIIEEREAIFKAMREAGWPI